MAVGVTDGLPDSYEEPGAFVAGGGDNGGRGGKAGEAEKGCEGNAAAGCVWALAT